MIMVNCGRWADERGRIGRKEIPEKGTKNLIVITYETAEYELDHWEISAGGEATPTMRNVIQKHRINFSRNLSELGRAKVFMAEMDDTEYNRKLHIIPDTEKAWANLLL